MSREETKAHPAAQVAAGQRWWIHVQNALTLGSLILGPIFRSSSLNWLQISVATILLSVGALVGILGVRTLGSNRTPHPAPLSNGALVRVRIYSVIRHPLYSSLILVTLGWSILWGSVPALLGSLALAIFLDQKARVEERQLTARFPEYSTYARSTRRFIPGIY